MTAPRFGILRRGDQGAAVRELQETLVRAGATLSPDGLFGDATETAVRAAQQRFGLAVDGVAGPATQQALIDDTAAPTAHRALHDGTPAPAAQQAPIDGIAAPKRLTDDALQSAAAALGVPVAAVRAVNEVESRGSGFLPDGRPVILYERHVMYRQLKAGGHDADALRDQFPDLVNSARGGYVGHAAEHGRLERSTDIDRSCALASASWGLFQIMGFHWATLGYASVEAFAAAMAESEATQLDAFVRFIKADGALHKALQALDWTTFARRYNGPAYKENLYDVKLARAYERYAGTGTA
jgi:hypothetical protein